MNKTYGQMMDEALKINNQEDADNWFLGEVKTMKKANPTWNGKKCASVVRHNLGYMAGYYDNKVSEHVAKYWGADHPIFGNASYWDTLKPGDAFNKGVKKCQD